MQVQYVSAAAAHPGSVALHMASLAFRSRQIATFGASSMRAAAAAAVCALRDRAFSAELEANTEGSSWVDSIQRGGLLLVLRAAYAERAAGYSERGVALLQANLELNLHCPAELRNVPWPARLEAFEEFWEAEVPR